MVLSLKIRIWINPPAAGGQDISVGEGLLYGVLLCTFLSGLLSLITLINLGFSKTRHFYTRFFILILFSSLIFFGLLAV